MPRAEELAVQLTCAAIDAAPDEPVAWRPGDEPPPDVVPLLGSWWTEGNELVVSFRDGRFRAELVGGPAGRSISWFVREAADLFRVADGRGRGEQLRVVRDDGGAVVKLYFATYPVTRTPQTFGNSVGDRINPVPNTVSQRLPAE